jgi:hypothetical protein
VFHDKAKHKIFTTPSWTANGFLGTNTYCQWSAAPTAVEIWVVFGDKKITDDSPISLYTYYASEKKYLDS